MYIRPASVRDAEALREVHAASWRAAYRGLVPDEHLEERVGRKDVEWYHNMIDRPGTPRAGTFVAVDEEEVVGFSHFTEAGDEDLDATFGDIVLFYLVPEAWGRGIARPLLDHTLDDLRSLGFRTAVLGVFRDNARACRFYESAGFRRDDYERFQDYGGKELAIVRYRLQL
jgi:ribosomal protein S18 acetylase RimI-like enzyme